jgi:hypothetical protein
LIHDKYVLFFTSSKYVHLYDVFHEIYLSLLYFCGPAPSTLRLVGVGLVLRLEFEIFMCWTEEHFPRNS